MKKMELKRKQKRETIITAAQQTFQQYGYVGTSMDMIAAKAKLTKQTLYRYFQSKEILFKESLKARREGTGFMKELDREDSKKALLKFATGFLMIHMSEEHLAGIRLLIAEGPKAPEIAKVHHDMGPAKVTSALSSFFEKRFKVDNPDFTAESFLNTLLAGRMDILTGLKKVPTDKEIRKHSELTIHTFMKLLS